MKKYLLSLLLLTVTLTLSATERPMAKMRQAAVKTLNANKAKATLSKPTLEVYNDGSSFTIVSRDDRFPEVLAYGVGNFDIETAPANVKWWFEAVQRSMEKAVKENAPRRAATTYTAVAPMMTTKWGQNAPYNNYCPVFEKEKTKAPTGCVATAMAQMMNYQQYPASAKFEGSYSIDDKDKTEMVETTYSWPYQLAYGYYLPTADGEVANMSYTPLQGNKVAALMRDCGYAIGMSYDPSGSGGIVAYAGQAFVEKFSYPKQSVKYLDRNYYSDEEWMQMIASELGNNTPILYGGYSESGGHAFVFHGMDAEGKVYVNWGWDGMYDGYFAIDVLTPGSDDFSEGQEMVIGTRSTALETDVYHSLFVTDAPYEFSYDNEKKELTITLVKAVYNSTCRDFKGKWALVVEDMTNPEKTDYADLLEDGTIVQIFSGYRAQSISNEFIVEPGTYHIYMATADAGESNWQYIRTLDGVFYYEMTVADDGTVTIATTPTFTTGSGAEAPEIQEIPEEVDGIQHVISNPANTSAPRYYDLQGREVSGSTKGLLIRRQGDEVKKVMVK